jgi:preprotein translocase subunit YajC
MIISLLAQAQPAQPGGSSLGGLTTMIWMAAMFIILYYVMIRPQTKRQKEQQRLIAALKTGDRVVTSAGIHGMITNVKDTTVTLKVADNVKLELEKSAVTNVLKSNGAS